ncbi:hypothetical protein [Oceanibium sediminis]|uniref:hypothetical protein n=1 Tax=Oceanibium sediminis TaxID=2026339 RepID=UPI000DD2EC5D|nr:hypothetical protein [Oceanibium sediminis]
MAGNGLRAASAGALVSAALLLSACTPETQDRATRQAAKGVVNTVIASRFPGLPAQPVTDCVIDNATTSEILTLASASLTGVTETTQATTLAILQRPGTVRCLATSGTSGVLAGL